MPGAPHHAQQGVRRPVELVAWMSSDCRVMSTSTTSTPAAAATAATLPTTCGAPAPQRSISSPTRAARSRAQRTWVSSGASPGMRMYRYGVRRSRSAIGMGSVGDSPWKMRPWRSRGRPAHSVGTTCDAQPGAVVRGHHVGPVPVTVIASTHRRHDEQDAGRHLARPPHRGRAPARCCGCPGAGWRRPGPTTR